MPLAARAVEAAPVGARTVPKYPYVPFVFSRSACRSDFQFPNLRTIGLGKTWRRECEHDSSAKQYFFHPSLLICM